MESLSSIIELGLIYTLVVIAVFITSRVIKLDDLTLEGSFNLGGSLGAFLLVHQIHPLLALLAALLAGALAGVASGLVHTRLQINHLISGLGTSCVLYSVSLKLVGAHQVLGRESSIFAWLAPWLGVDFTKLVVLALIVSLVIAIITWVLKSELGLHLKAVGCNGRLFALLAKEAKDYQVIGLAIANSLSALSGALFMQWLGFYAISNYVGTWIAGLNGLMISELIPSMTSFGWVLGSWLNQALFAAILEFDIDPLWNQAIKALLVMALLRVSKRAPSKKKRRVSHVVP